MNRRLFIAGLMASVAVPTLPKVMEPVFVGIDYGAGDDMTAIMIKRMNDHRLELMDISNHIYDWDKAPIIKRNPTVAYTLDWKRWYWCDESSLITSDQWKKLNDQTSKT